MCFGNVFKHTCRIVAPATFLRGVSVRGLSLVLDAVELGRPALLSWVCIGTPGLATMDKEGEKFSSLTTFCSSNRESFSISHWRAGGQETWLCVLALPLLPSFPQSLLSPFLVCQTQ